MQPKLTPGAAFGPNIDQRSNSFRGMSALRLVFDNRIHIFAMPLVVTLFWCPALRYPVPPEYLAMLFFFVAGAYIQNMISDAEEDSINYRRNLRLFSPHSPWSSLTVVVCILISMACAITAGLQFLLYATAVNFLGYLYGATITLKTGSRRFVIRLKSVPVLKNAYAAFFWSALLVVTPYIFSHLTVPLPVLPVIALTFIATFIAEILWDVRDEVGDRTAEVRTIPVLLGEKRTRALLHVLNGLFAILLSAFCYFQSLPSIYWGLLTLPIFAVPFWGWFFQASTDKDWGSHMYLLMGCVPIVAIIAISQVMGQQ